MFTTDVAIVSFFILVGFIPLTIHYALLSFQHVLHCVIHCLYLTLTVQTVLKNSNKHLFWYSDCQPPCQNRGSCSRPHTCVCRSGFQGERCEEVAPEQVYIRTGTSRVLTPVRPGSESSQRQPGRRRPTERQAIDPVRTQTPKPPTTRVPHSPIRGSPDISPQQTGTSRTVKRYPSSSGPITSNALPSSNGNGFSSHGYSHTQHRSSSSRANLTTGMDRIKIVFTPMVCRRTCNGGRCYNSCERGDKTTIYSKSQGPEPKSQGFRLFFCQLPCLNGGRCIGQNECWCPSNSTGKFCHLPAPTPSKPTPSRKANSNGVQNGSSHSMYTLPLSNQQASMLPSLVNVHVQHPPEAEVQIHQVARVKPGQTADGAHSVQQRSQPGNSNGNGSGHYTVHSYGQNGGHSHHGPHHRLNGYVGRCFQETIDGQCGKPLPGLTKQEDCCGSVGASWGLNKCTKCPSKPAYAVIANGQVECPKGYKRMNSTHCQDINECLMPGICKHAECLNTKGSYRCTCKPGYMLDPARSHCVSDKAVSMEKASCYRSVSAGSCGLPLSLKITKQICCCSRVGKAWGSHCERCPLPNTDLFKEICPAGHGYTYSRSDIQITLRELDEEEISTVESFLSQIPTYSQPEQTPPETSDPLPQLPISPQPPYYHPQAPTRPQPPKTPQPGQPPRTAQVPHHPYTDPQHHVHVSPSLPEDIDKCSLTPTICGPGQCVSVQTGYTCYCDPGYKLNGLQTTCIDVNECEDDPCGGKGHCVNTYGSYTCQCFSGFSLLMTQNKKTCQDVNECAIPNKCPNGRCINTEGSFTCECKSGFTQNWRGQCEDVDECRSPSVCPGGICVNTQGSFQCQACGPGFRPAGGRCVDINECQTAGACANGRCVNTEGSFICTCNHGYQTTLRNDSCQDVNECLVPDICPHGTCVNLPGSHRCNCNTGYQTSPDGKACEDVDECAHPSLCVEGVCVNTVGYFTCTQCEVGYTLSEDRQRCEGESVSTLSTLGSLFEFSYFFLTDIDECLSLSTCPNGICLNSDGSFSCVDCPTGYSVSADGERCDDVDECGVAGTCTNGQCMNTDGSYQCLCESGYEFSEDTKECEDLDECKSYSDVCGTWNCENTLGSYRCFMGCQSGFYGEENKDCDIDECEDETICGKHGFCENTDGSYRCQCDRGYTSSPERQICVDVNECETHSDLCGEALCENAEGSFLCICPNENEEFDPVTSQCSQHSTDLPAVEMCCYYNLNDANLCENVLSRNVTKQECCCTVGAGWGDNCEIHPCPIKGHGTACTVLFLPTDADECEMFGPEICKNGHCSNFYSTYSCFCRSGYYYDHIRMECVDYDECKEENLCEHGLCVNTPGSYNCFCSPPLVLDSTQRHCISINITDGEFHNVHVDICWQELKADRMCSHPMLDTRTTYTECCCVSGVAWGSQCALCPGQTSSEFAELCNQPQRGSDSLRERPGFEYGPDASPDGPYWDSYGHLGGDPYYIPEGPLNGPIFPDPSSDYSHNEGFEGLQAEECGILNGCENGRCVRVREGYTCDCFDGYELDLSKMACIDINECKDISDKVELCKNGVCSNTEGSYTCTCLPGFLATSKPHECIAEDQASAPHTEGK
uniref:Latent transforming growth factor beta binding protein 2 n=1 Tax=Pygocentrus nattereri TaxID=42514 RepID=A0A3B4BZ25_PYGNA